MNERVEKIKAHLRENKKTYIAGGVCLVVGVTGGTVMRLGFVEDAKIVQKIYQIAWRPENKQMIINLVERSTPSKPVHLVGTNLFFNSLSEAARMTGHNLRDISKNVNGHVPNVKGDVFQLLESAS